MVQPPLLHSRHYTLKVVSEDFIGMFLMDLSLLYQYMYTVILLIFRGVGPALCMYCSCFWCPNLLQLLYLNSSRTIGKIWRYCGKYRDSDDIGLSSKDKRYANSDQNNLCEVGMMYLYTSDNHNNHEFMILYL